MDKWVKYAIIVIAVLCVIYISGSVVYWGYNVVTAISNLHVRLTSVEQQLKVKDNGHDKRDKRGK